MSDVHNPTWWKSTTVYEIVVRSFADGNGDGVGDLAGLHDRLDYLEWLGIETIWLTPIFASPHFDFGYDVSGYRQVAPEYGTLDDLARLVEALHARGMKLVLDLVLNHTSSEHPWFIAAKRGRHDPHRDFYIWQPGRKPGGAAPPNNWLSVTGKTGWHYDANSDEWYWVTFTQPDLNWRNPQVKLEMLDVARSWLRAGVDGFRLDLFSVLFKDASFRDNPRSHRPLPGADNPDGFFQRPVHTQNHPDTIAFARELRAVVDEFHDPTRFVVGEMVADSSTLTRYCGGASADGLHLAFDFKTLGAKFTAKGFRALVEELEHTFPAPLTPTCAFGNHDRPRVMARLGDDPARARLLAAFQLTVRAVPVVYYGEELGLSHPPAQPLATSHDPIANRFHALPRFVYALIQMTGVLLNRDETRSPMPWAPGPSAGFSPPGAEPPWLPLHPRAQTVNVAVQRNDPGSVLATYRRVLALRRRCPALSGGRLDLVELHGAQRSILAYRRTDGISSALVVLNFSARARTVDLRGEPGTQLWSSLRDEPSTPSPTCTLAPWEAAILV